MLQGCGVDVVAKSQRAEQVSRDAAIEIIHVGPGRMDAARPMPNELTNANKIVAAHAARE